MLRHGIAVCLAALFFVMPAMAHRLTVFAWMEGETIVAESTFGRGGKLKGGTVEVRDAVTGSLLFKGVTDDSGMFRCILPEAIRTSGHDMQIVALGGEGHRGEWLIKADEWNTSLAKGGAQAPEQTAPAHMQNEPPKNGQTLSSGGGFFRREELEQVVGDVLETKLAPLRRELAAMNSGGPEVRDVVGGLGWIIGLFGMLAWCRSKKER